MTATYFRLQDGALRQDWSDGDLITANDSWSGVPSIEGFLGSDLTSATGADPQAILTSNGVLDVIANQTSPGTLSNGGVAEFRIADPTVALNGSGTADAPSLVLYLDTTGVTGVTLSFNARDLDGSADNAVQPLAVQYRLGDAGDWRNLPDGHVADATGGPNQAGLVTPVSVLLPAAAAGQPAVQLRILTANAVGSDEWVGIDDILVTATPTTPDPTATVSVAALDADRAEGDAGSTGFTFQVSRSSGAGAASVAYRVVAPGGAGVADAADLGGSLPGGTLAFAAGETSRTVTVAVTGDTATEGDETFQLVLEAPLSGLAIGSGTAQGTIRDDDVTITRISAIQGAGAASPLLGSTRTVDAIVVGDFQNGDADAARNLGGFYLQEEAADADGNPLTSEGLFVFQGSLAGVVALGDRVRVSGTVSEYFGLTQLNATAIQVLQASAVAEVDSLATSLSLPADAVTLSQNGAYQPDLEAYEGMLVRVAQTLTITDQFNLDRFNEIRLAAGDRPVQYTVENAPSVAGYDAAQRAIGARSIVYDDGLNTQNNPVERLDGFAPYGTAGAPRMGDTVTGLTGVLDYQWAGNAASGATWRIRAVMDGANDFVDGNPRPAEPEAVGGTLRLASFNVLNYFTTLNAGGNTTAIGMAPRGANSAAELERQTDKLVQSVLGLDADVLGLLELENDFLPGAPGNAIETLVARLNAVDGAGEWAWIDPGSRYLGGDAIAVGFIYRTAAVRVAPGTTLGILDDSDVDPALLARSEQGHVFNGPNTSRAALAVTFEDLASGETFTAALNHLKSKSGVGSGLDADQLDGAGAFNNQRQLAAEALDAWLDGHPTGSADPDVVILGDLNTYARESPIRTLVEQGYENLQATRIEDPYSYVFGGQTGSLDQILTSPSLSAQVTGVTEWHVNADEADALDYNLDFGRDPNYFDAAIPARVSDHDPLLIGLELGPVAPVLRAGTLVDDGVLTTLTAAVLSASDLDTPPGALRFELVGDAAAGGLLRDGRILEEGDAFTAADIAAGRIAYLTGFGDDGFDVAVIDEAGNLDVGTVAVRFTPFDRVQEAPRFGGYWGGAGRDSFSGTEGEDHMDGAEGGDSLFGGGGGDSLIAGDGSDLVSGGDGDDRLYGGAGDDVVFGDDGADYVEGGPGNDLLSGGAGDGDVITGNAGDDIYLYRRGDGRDSIIGLHRQGADRLDLRDFDVVLGEVDSWAELLASGRVQSPRIGGDTVIDLGDGDVLTLRWTNAFTLGEADVLFA